MAATRGTPMEHLFDTVGRTRLAATLRRRPLLVFDFDGTLAPIVDRPEDAVVPNELAALLSQIGRRLTVAIVTGRSVGDVRDRLGFTPAAVFGSHGAEDGSRPVDAGARSVALDPLRTRIDQRRGELAEAGVWVEDKRLSLALHYRLATDRDAALALIRSLLSPPIPALRTFGGKMVENVVAADAPDKAHAVATLADRHVAGCVIFVGDDVNDEPVFAAARPSWLTVRVGYERRSSAQFYLRGLDEVASMLERVLSGLQDTAGT